MGSLSWRAQHSDVASAEGTREVETETCTEPVLGVRTLLAGSKCEFTHARSLARARLLSCIRHH
eukprot:4807555-Amphidinium_carterae.2